MSKDDRPILLTSRQKQDIFYSLNGLPNPLSAYRLLPKARPFSATYPSLFRPNSWKVSQLFRLNSFYLIQYSNRLHTPPSSPPLLPPVFSAATFSTASAVYPYPLKRDSFPKLPPLVCLPIRITKKRVSKINHTQAVRQRYLPPWNVPCHTRNSNAGWGSCRSEKTNGGKSGADTKWDTAISTSNKGWKILQIVSVRTRNRNTPRRKY